MTLPTALLTDLAAIVGPQHVLAGPDTLKYQTEWSGHYHPEPAAVVRPASTLEVSEVVKACARHTTPLVPVSGLTGLTGAAMTHGLMLSVERLNKIREIRPATRIAVVEAGVILQSLHDAAERANLYFPLWFGARGSAMIGGVLSTNAGGSNVVRYGSTRALCLGLEVVLPDGRILNLMSELHKNNSGYDLRQMFIGAEGTLGIITAAVMKLVPRPKAYATATLAARSLPDALDLLNTLQEASGGAVEAFEYMPGSYMQRLSEARPDIRLPFSQRYDTNILVELAATAPKDSTPDEHGQTPIVTLLETTLAHLIETGAVLDAEIAQNTTQRLAMWKRRELAAEITNSRQPSIDTDIALPLHLIPEFYTRITPRLLTLDPKADTLTVAHLGDGNLHYTVFPTRKDPVLHEAVLEAVEDVVEELGGSFSAEHGVGLSKLNTMARRKDPVALDVMRAVKAALDPQNLMNPGKVIPPQT